MERQVVLLESLLFWYELHSPPCINYMYYSYISHSTSRPIHNAFAVCSVLLRIYQHVTDDIR